MKILMLANHLNYGGITAYCHNLARALNGKGEVEIVVASRGGDLESELVSAGIRHVRLPLTTKCEVSPKVFRSFFQLLPIVEELGIDLFHANTRVTQVLAALLSKKTGRPYLSTCHGYFKPRFSRRLFPCWGQKVIAISDQVREHLLGDFHLDPQRIELIYNGVDLEKFKPIPPEAVRAEKGRLGLDADKKTVGHIGRLSSVKGQKFFVLAAAEVAAKRKDIQFLIIGDGEEGEHLKRLIREKGLEDAVFIRPSMPQTAVALSLMDVFCMPSLQEGLGISILEAQAQGVPVVASRVGGIPSIVEDGKTGLLCEPKDPVVLAAALLKILNDETLKNTLVQKAKAQVREKFSLGLMAERTRSLYRSLTC